MINTEQTTATSPARPLEESNCVGGCHAEKSAA
jgi:hypothetical protein